MFTWAAGFYPGSTEPLHLTVEISRRAPLVPSGVVEVPAPGFNSRNPIRVMSSQAPAVSKEFALTALNCTEVRDLPMLPQPVAAAIDEKTFEELCLRVGERVERWIQGAQAKLEGEKL